MMFISPDLEGHRAPPKWIIRPAMFPEACPVMICFTICLFISPDLEGHRAPPKWIIRPAMFPEACPMMICFTICLFISPDLDGHRAPKMKFDDHVILGPQPVIDPVLVAAFGGRQHTLL